MQTGFNAHEAVALVLNLERDIDIDLFEQPVARNDYSGMGGGGGNGGADRG